MATPVTSNPPVILPKEGTARVKSVLSGDTLILLGKATNPQRPPPEVLFTFEGLSAPRYAYLKSEQIYRIIDMYSLLRFPNPLQDDEQDKSGR
jgi:hypothetical protein